MSEAGCWRWRRKGGQSGRGSDKQIQRPAAGPEGQDLNVKAQASADVLGKDTGEGSLVVRPEPHNRAVRKGRRIHNLGCNQIRYRPGVEECIFRNLTEGKLSFWEKNEPLGHMRCRRRISLLRKWVSSRDPSYWGTLGTDDIGQSWVEAHPQGSKLPGTPRESSSRSPSTSLQKSCRGWRVQATALWNRVGRSGIKQMVLRIRACAGFVIRWLRQTELHISEVPSAEVPVWDGRAKKYTSCKT